jgi:hypothetical protein
MSAAMSAAIRPTISPALSAAVSAAPPPPRLADWPERLADFIESRRGVPFAWGVNDCVSFAFDGLHALTGADPLAPLRGRWANDAQALQVLQSMGGLAWAVCSLLGRPLPTPAAAPRGALVCARMQGLPTLGLHLGVRWCAPGAQGLVFRPAHEVRLAWGV